MSSVATPMAFTDQHSAIVGLTLEGCELCRAATSAAVIAWLLMQIRCRLFAKTKNGSA